MYIHALKRNRLLVWLAAFGLAAMSASAAAPANDNFADRIVVEGSNLTITADSSSATLEAGEPMHPGAPFFPGGVSGPITGSHSVWWSWTAPRSGLLSVDSAGSSFGSMVEVYTGSVLTNLTLIAFDNPNGYSSSYFRGKVRVPVIGGTTYAILVDVHSGSGGGAITLSLQLNTTPTNDNFADRIALTGANPVLEINNLGATEEPGDPKYAPQWWTWPPPGESAWWSWTASLDGDVAIKSASPLPSKTFLGVYTGSTLGSLSLTADNSTNQNQVMFRASSGTTYQILVDGALITNSFQLTFGIAPANDAFAQRIVLIGTNAAFVADNTHASRENGEPNPANSVGGKSVWWSWAPSQSGQAIITVESGSTANTLLSVYTGALIYNLYPLASNAGNSAQVTFPAYAGRHYQIAVDGRDGATISNSFNLHLDVGATIPPMAAAQLVFTRSTNSQFGPHLTIELQPKPTGAQSLEYSQDRVHWNPFGIPSSGPWNVYLDPTNSATFYRAVIE